MKLAVRGRATLTAVVAAVALTVAPAGMALATDGDWQPSTSPSVSESPSPSVSSSPSPSDSPTPSPTQSAPSSPSSTTTTVAPSSPTTTSTTGSRPTRTTSTTHVPVPPVEVLFGGVFGKCPTVEQIEAFVGLSQDQQEAIFAELDRVLSTGTDAEIADYLGVSVADWTKFNSLSEKQMLDLVESSLTACFPVEDTPSFTG